jgi:16S rRNA (cytidine1402-2'-O)-methyltransferase
MITYFGAERQISVSRELTKMFEETVRGTVAEVKTYFETHPVKGEFVICVAAPQRKVLSLRHRTKPRRHAKLMETI